MVFVTWKGHSGTCVGTAGLRWFLFISCTSSLNLRKVIYFLKMKGKTAVPPSPHLPPSPRWLRLNQAACSTPRAPSPARRCQGCRGEWCERVSQVQGEMVEGAEIRTESGCSRECSAHPCHTAHSLLHQTPNSGPTPPS